jgi:hypothetical protein
MHYYTCSNLLSLKQNLSSVTTWPLAIVSRAANGLIKVLFVSASQLVFSVGKLRRQK